jgi:spore germination protein KC
MDKHEGRGVSWTLGKVKSSIINVEGSENSIVSMETIRADGKIVPELQNKKVIIKINIFEEGNIGEQTGPENLSKLPAVAELEKKKTNLIRSEVMAAIQKAKELDADVFGFGDAVHQKYPKEWESMEDKWDKIFPEIQVEVNVKAKLRLMGRIFSPAVLPTDQEKE